MNDEPVAKHANEPVVVEFTERRGQETLHDQVFRRCTVKATAHEVVDLPFVDGGAGGPVGGGHIVSKHLKFWNGVRPCGFRQEQVAENLPGVAAVGAGGDDQPARANAAGRVAAGRVGD